jgi:uncharacterized protein YndB with AHSA1/START domain
MDATGEAYETQVRIEARPETVFGFFTDPARMLQWMGVDAALDCRPGGSYRVNVTGRETAIGEYVEITPYERIVMTWGWDSGPITPGSTRVEIDFVPDGEATILHLRHFGLDAEGMTSHEMGWTHYLERLVLAAAGHDPGQDPWTALPPN